MTPDEKRSLNDYLAGYQSARSELRKENAELRKENAELRELVRDMWRDIPKSESCGWDIDTNCCSGSDKCKGECAYWYRMRELGVEVEG